MTPRFLVAAAATLLLAATPAAAQFPIFDAHIHYSKPDWSAYTPEHALSILARAGVRRAIVSSTPDDGTLKLYDRAPAGIVPFLRPYRTRGDMGSWPRDLAVATYVEQRLAARGIYKGIGEDHLALGDHRRRDAQRSGVARAAAAGRRRADRLEERRSPLPRAVTTSTDSSSTAGGRSRI